MDDVEVREIAVQYRIALANLRTLIALHQAMGLEHASPELKAAGREVEELNARAQEWVDA